MNFSSLDVHLHTEALLNAMNYLNSLLPKQGTKVVEEPVHEKTEEKKDVLKKLSKFLYYCFLFSFLSLHLSKEENKCIFYFCKPVNDVWYEKFCLGLYILIGLYPYLCAVFWHIGQDIPLLCVGATESM